MAAGRGLRRLGRRYGVFLPAPPGLTALEGITLPAARVLPDGPDGVGHGGAGGSEVNQVRVTGFACSDSEESS